jgi:hypothetical protein
MVATLQPIMTVEIIHEGEQNIYSYPSEACYTDEQLNRDFQTGLGGDITDLGFTFVCSVADRWAAQYQTGEV